jgi:uncharacterized protein
MYEDQINTSRKLHPALSVFFILLLAGLGFIVGGIAGLYLYLPFYDGSEVDLFKAIQNLEDHPEIQPALFAAQLGATVGGLILAPFIYLRSQHLSIGTFFRHNKIPAFIFLLAGLIIIFSFGINSLFLEWNQKLVFPEFLKEFEDWARAREDEATRQTKAMTEMNSLTKLFLGILVIALLPAIGEEFVFRGIIQNELFRGTKNIHVSIWFAAILFSAIHFQFFGFIPRMVLGAIFGYLYYWSANLWVPIFAHFVNNGIQVLALYLYQRGAFNFDIDEPESVPTSMMIVSGIITAAMLYYFYKFFETRKLQTSPRD